MLLNFALSRRADFSLALFFANIRISGIASGQWYMSLFQAFKYHVTFTVVYYLINTIISELWCSDTKGIPLPGDLNRSHPLGKQTSSNKHDKSNSDEQERGKKGCIRELRQVENSRTNLILKQNTNLPERKWEYFTNAWLV